MTKSDADLLTEKFRKFLYENEVFNSPINSKFEAWQSEQNSQKRTWKLRDLLSEIILRLPKL